MSKNVSDKNRQTPQDMRKRETQKFISDDDIMGRTDWLQKGLHRQVRAAKAKSDAPIFLSDEDIVQRRAA